MAKKHPVIKGDTVSQIADKYGVRVQDIVAANPNLKDVNKIRVGQSLNIPAAKTGKNKGSQGPYGRTSKTEMAMMRKSGEQYATGVRAKMKAGAETTPTPKKAKATKAAKDTSAQAMEKARKRRAAKKKTNMAMPKTGVAKKRAENERQKKNRQSLDALRKKARQKLADKIKSQVKTAAKASRRKGRKA